VIDVLPFEAIINFTLTLQKGKRQPENQDDNARNFSSKNHFFEKNSEFG
jgi:hypothetical protein